MGTIENLWTVFVSGPMQITNGVNYVFANQFNTIGSISKSFFYSLIVYSVFLAIGIIVTIATIFINKASIKRNGFANNLTTKNIFTSMLIIIIFPIILFLISLFFNYLSPMILSAISNKPFAKINNEFFKNLYNIGNNTNIVLDVPVDNSFSAPISLNNWNIYVQIGVVNIIMWTLIYLLWNYAQKIIEIFILSITLPISSFIKNENKQIGVLIWMKEIWNKIVACICNITCFYFYIFSIQIIINTVSNVDYVAKYFLSFFLSIALLVVSIIITNIFNQKNMQYRGIIKSISSLRETIIFNFNTIQNKISKKEIVNDNNEDLTFQNTINNLKKTIKSNDYDYKNEAESLKDITIY